MTVARSPTHQAVPYAPRPVPPEEAARRGRALLEVLSQRRSVRSFSEQAVPRELITLAIQAAATAPSGANLQPWRFVAVQDAALKSRMRAAAEHEERINYGGRMSEAWRADLAHLGTGPDKPSLEQAPWLVAVFAERYRPRPEGDRANYYVKESVGIACGMFVVALQHMGLYTVPHTPSPMKFLNELLGRPAEESACLLFPVGYPAADCRVPLLSRKSLEDVAEFR